VKEKMEKRKQQLSEEKRPRAGSPEDQLGS